MGFPGSPEFGYGAILYPEGPDLKESLALADDLGMDWIAIPFDWNLYQLDPAIPPGLDGLNPMIETTADRGILVMLSITHSPQWATTPDGPDPENTASLASLLSIRYSSALKAVELFPGANTRQGWGAAASPLAYSRMFQVVSDRLRGENQTLVLRAAGLQPLPEILREGDLQDLMYLQALVDLGASGWMPVVSLRFPEITGKPMLLSSSRESRVLRHDEDICVSSQKVGVLVFLAYEARQKHPIYPI